MDMKNEIPEQEVIRKYTSGEIPSLENLAKHFKMGKKKVKDILTKNDIPLRKKGAQFKHGNSKTIEEYKFKKSRKEGGNKQIAICKETGKIFNDTYDKSGALTKHVRELYDNPEIPSNTYQKKKFYLENSYYWFEKYFDIKEVDELPTRKCQHCGWETIDVYNKTGSFEIHLQNEHQITLEQHLELYPEDIKYHKTFKKRREREKLLSESKERVECEICGEKLRRITTSHLKKHGLTLSEYKIRYSRDTLNEGQKQKQAHKMVELNKTKIKFDKYSKYETELHEFLDELGVYYEKNDRFILNGKEMDIIIPDKKIGIEFNGNKWHTEFFGRKDRNYHLRKTNEAQENGYGLIHIFEDEWVLRKDIIKSKLKHLLGKTKGVKVGARKCEIEEISKEKSKLFLEENHVQGKDRSSIELGAYHNDRLVSVMTFKIRDRGQKIYELSRFATKMDYIVPGIGSKLLNHFIKNYECNEIVSFADRRWTLNENENLYTKLGFNLDGVIKPDYKYYNEFIDIVKRYHKFGFRKQILLNKYPNLLNKDMTEAEMTTELGYDRIWDCGLLKYVLTV